jgi:CubicO group peptidase (beta-lactamase class C family)
MRLRWHAAALLLVVLAGRAAAQAPALTLATALDTARVDSLVRANMAERRLVGISLGIVQDGRIVYLKGYGAADRATGAPVDTATRFAIGSITKQFTCAIILQLAAEGRLSIDERVSRWYPELTRAADITIRDLMGHVSGYTDYYPLDFVDRRMLRPIGADSLLRWYGRAPLDFVPVTRYSYSNTGYIILGRIAERVAGRPFERLLRERIFQPLGLRNTVYDPPRGNAHDARGYNNFAMSEPQPAVPEARGWVGAAGGIWTTPADLLRWDIALMEGRVVGGELLRAMTTARTLTGGATTGYGFGLAVGMARGDTLWSHSGGVAGFISQSMMLPRTRSAIVALSNIEGTIAVGQLLRLTMPLLPVPPPDTTRRQVTPPAPSPVPVIQGPPAREMATTLYRQLQAGRVDRALLGEEFNWWLDDERVRGAAERLGPLGEPTRIETGAAGERGGMEVTFTRFVYASRVLGASMYRTPDGRVQQFLVNLQ